MGVQISACRAVGGNAALGPRIYEGAVTAVGGDWGSPNILPPASFHSATPLASAGGKGCGAYFKQCDKLKFAALGTRKWKKNSKNRPILQK